MKPYFVKYVDVSGEIKVGDKIRSESASHHIVTVTKIEDDIYWTDERDFQDAMGISYFGVKREKAQKVGELMLCRRDVKIGDKVKFKDISVEVDIPIDEKNWDWLSKHAPWTIIGEVSEAAKWVKEGMEFSDDDLLALPGAASIMKPISKWPSAHLVNVTIYVKCPSCGNFK